MTLEDEKKLVAEKLGFMLGKALTGHTNIGTKLFLDFILLAAWNPQTQIQWWPEIWDKMDEKTFSQYSVEVDKIIGFPVIKANGNVLSWGSWKRIHTAKPEICWKALIKTLGES